MRRAVAFGAGLAIAGALAAACSGDGGSQKVARGGSGGAHAGEGGDRAAMSGSKSTAGGPDAGVDGGPGASGAGGDSAAGAGGVPDRSVGGSGGAPDAVAGQGGDSSSPGGHGGAPEAKIGPDSPECSPPASADVEHHVSYGFDCTEGSVCEFSGSSGGQPRYSGADRCNCKNSLNGGAEVTTDTAMVIDPSLACSPSCVGFGFEAPGMQFNMTSTRCARVTTLDSDSTVVLSGFCESVPTNCTIFTPPEGILFYVTAPSTGWARVETAAMQGAACPLACD